ncbi:MAG: tRNA (guanosine(37)-N1)-methyltransferase TrmD [Zetaproteobacteria bacterium CG12_big_fil_rev_8_21_14_0_65_55_1124]|nr:MAG: tRNA (guanosine(37)-N1)-methyltransferase TrmD [Zetaproteobacteria bacterium CG1_02_55_237]PIS19211.1 MAG: tRNA (guanosine(37)-N1)-methyltransferase TrmD [Zetaproteobacteria bacterium CG08_land_8_20_14_0_20_55_17]PIW42928.1 MAG: tRNA (guanosine(37)-N1)-methyltransferase TrmD [Zetaproteobacteria bacterium CG12_big_fil_rev_8_21_14_0_65_55_1124]PIY51848.1 MAG: tRNA (guanosine(37)-N1)-methyltransferase TrmD [Zetaproteobacteria bacterium CG_4_10_14_0_8_um_filter_55_43]PIZ39908.1 MAG: tRNA (g
MFYAQILTLFPEFFASPLACSIPKRAIEAELARVDCIQIRDFATDKHRSVDDSPYGGGPGMLMKPEPLVAAIRDARRRRPETRVVMLTPSGVPFTQDKALEYARMSDVTLLCGRYEGFDERIVDYVDEQLSLGDYVLSGGEPAALCVLDAVIRLLPGVLGSAESAVLDSFSEEGILDWPHYTRPEEFEGKRVPDVLLSGNHAEIEKWRKEQSRLRSKRRSSS